MDNEYDEFQDIWIDICGNRNFCKKKRRKAMKSVRKLFELCLDANISLGVGSNVLIFRS